MNMTKMLYQSVVLFGACIFVVSCGVDEMRWKEQVRLHNDQYIYIDRYASRLKSGFPNSRRGPILDQELRYAPLDIIWEVQDEVPISFEIFDGVAYIAAVPFQARHKFCIGKPRGAYVARFYRWQQGKLQSIAQDAQPVSRMRMNISGVSQWGLTSKGDSTYLSWPDVARVTGQREDGPPMLLRDKFAKDEWLHCK